MSAEVPASLPLSIVVPCFNEERRIGGTLDAIASYLSGAKLEAEVIVVDDGSPDRTSEVARTRSEKLQRLLILRHETNSGKGYAVGKGIEAASGRYVLFSDADLSTPIEEWAVLAAHLEAGADLAIGSRRMGGSRIEIPQSSLRKLMGATFVTLQHALVGGAFSDTQCGFKAFRREVALDLFGRSRVKGFCFDVEILALAAASGYRIDEVPVRWRDDRDSRINPVRDASRMFWDLMVIRWNLATGKYAPRGSSQR